MTLDGEPGSGRLPRNGHAGWPAMGSVIAPWVALRVTLDGTPDAQSSYLRNIKEVDQAARERALPLLTAHVRAPDGAARGFAALPAALVDALRDAWPGARLHAVELCLSPYTAIGCLATELPMVRLSHRFEFSAAHRLHNEELDDETNRRTFGKCNNPHGHGHNYELQVTVTGAPDASGVLIALPELERIVQESAVEPFDHKHLNVEVPEFSSGGLNPSVENIAMVLYRRLKPRFSQSRAGLASVTVWETPKTWCEYSE